MEVILFGLIFAIIGILLIVSINLNKNKCTEVTKGTVIDLVKAPTGGDIMRPRHAVYQYTVNNETITVTSKIGNRPCKFQVGDEVEIHYNPEQPNKCFTEADSKSEYVLAAIFIAGGIVFTSIFLIFK